MLGIASHLLLCGVLILLQFFSSITSSLKQKKGHDEIVLDDPFNVTLRYLKSIKFESAIFQNASVAK